MTGIRDCKESKKLPAFCPEIPSLPWLYATKAQLN